MLTRDDILQLMRENRDYLSDEYGVKRIGLFGSYAHGDPNPESGIDLVVEFQQPIGFRFMELADYLEALLGQSVDILTMDGIKEIRSKNVASHIVESVVYV